ncbi:MAG: type IX secretion system membrane protein PorP/SprF [Bacteroidota bacterium]
MRNRILTLMLLLSALASKGQELTIPTLSQYLADNPFVIAPTYAGIGDHVKIRLNGLTQWVGIEDAPDTQSLAADMRVGERSGIGLVLYNDSNGFTEQKGARVSFAHHLTLDRYDDEFLSFGVSYNFNQFRINTDEITDIVLDPGFDGDRATDNHNFDIGVLYRKDKFYLNLSASNILNKDFNDFDALFEPNTLRNYFVYTGYRYRKNKNSNMEIEPSILYKVFESDGRSEVDANVKFRWYDFEDYYYAGVNYRFLIDQTGDPLFLAPFAGLKKNNFYFGYSYQIILNEILGFSTGTHVVTVGIDLFQGLSNCRCTY